MQTEQIEEWRSVVGYEGLYEVSNLGRVRSMSGAFKYHRATILKPKKSSQYATIWLSDGTGKQKSVTVHKLVAAAFIGPRPDGLEVNHKNGNKHDPSLGNIEYMTKSQNAIHAYHVIKTRIAPTTANPGCAAKGDRNGSRLHPNSRPRGNGHANSKLTEADVISIRARFPIGRSVPGRPTLQQLADEFGISRQSVWYIVHRRGWTHI